MAKKLRTGLEVISRAPSAMLGVSLLMKRKASESGLPCLVLHLKILLLVAAGMLR
jgi:hypothetical protein